MFLVSPLKLFSFWRYLDFFLIKHLDYKDKVNFKIYDFRTWLTKSANTRIAQYIKK